MNSTLHTSFALHIKYKEQKMKKIITIALVLVLALSLLIACGNNGNSSPPGTSQGNNDTTPSNNNGGGTAVKGITVDNWTTVVKDNYGLDLTMPDGWEVTKAYSPNNVDNVKVLYKTGGTGKTGRFGRLLSRRSGLT